MQYIIPVRLFFCHKHTNVNIIKQYVNIALTAGVGEWRHQPISKHVASITKEYAREGRPLIFKLTEDVTLAKNTSVVYATCKQPMAKKY